MSRLDSCNIPNYLTYWQDCGVCIIRVPKASKICDVKENFSKTRFVCKKGGGYRLRYVKKIVFFLN